MIQNPQNASISIGSPKGIVSVFIPSLPEPAMKINCHNAQVTSQGFSFCGKYLATVGSDSSIKIWDIRRTYNCIAEYFSPFPVSSMDISQKNIMALGGKSSVLMFKDWTRSNERAKGYLKHVDHKRRIVNSVQFVPYEDYLGVAMQGAFSSITVPGSCSVDFDSFTHNVTGIKAQTRENAVHKLLEKLPMESIVLNPGQIGKVDPTSRDVLEKEKQEEKRLKNAQKIRNRKRKKRNKMQAHKFKQMQRNEIIRNQIREDKFARKELYRAEEEKRISEGTRLNSNLPDFVKMGKKG
jgi:U3 small nucleolar RNA-associated protein 7